MADTSENEANIFKTPDEGENVFANVEEGSVPTESAEASPEASAEASPEASAETPEANATNSSANSSSTNAFANVPANSPANAPANSPANSPPANSSANSPPANSPANSPANAPANTPPANASANTPANSPKTNNSINAPANSPKTNSSANAPKTNSPANAPKTNSPANAPEANTGASPLSALNESPVKANKTKRRRSTKQREADEGQKQMLDMLRGMYNKEFADIPEKFRPKPKAYVARAAFYKKEGPERDKYIETWLLSDRTAADARMGVNVGKKRLKETANFSNEYVLDTLPSIVSEATGSSEKFHPSMDTLRERAKKAVQKMNDITDRTQDGLMKRIKQPVVRKTASYLFKETRKLVKRLGGEINTQARHLQQAARNYIDNQKKGAQTSIQKKAEANLTVALGKKPNKRLTHRLTRLRNTGRGVSIRNFLNAEEKAGRLPKTLKKNWRKGLPEGTAPLNDYANDD